MEPLQSGLLFRNLSQRYLGEIGPHLDHHADKAEAHIPLGELAIHKGASVIALDGSIGQVSAFIVKTGGKHITHIILDENIPPCNEHIVLPVADIQRIEKDCVYLNLMKDDIEQPPYVDYMG